MTRRQGELDQSAARPTSGVAPSLWSQTQIRALYWAMGGISISLSTLLIVVLFAISKADAAQATASEVKQQQGITSTDLQWIKETLKRMEQEIKGQ